MRVSSLLHMRFGYSDHTFFMCVSVAGQITLIFTSGLSSEDASHPKSHVYCTTSRMLHDYGVRGVVKICHTISFVSICLTFPIKSSEKEGSAVFSIRTMAGVVDGEVRESGYLPKRVTLRETGSDKVSHSYAMQKENQHDGAPSLRTRSSWNSERSKLITIQLHYIKRRDHRPRECWSRRHRQRRQCEPTVQYDVEGC